jgi:DNA-directed RNA polymerase alpha subunit
MNYFEIPIEKLKLSNRSFNALKREKIDFVGQLLELNETDLYQIKNLGKGSVEEILAIVNDINKKANIKAYISEFDSNLFKFM